MDGGLGFRDLEYLNLAMLANQWWKIIHRENSLVLKVLQHKYFANVKHRGARVKANSSYIWLGWKL